MYFESGRYLQANGLNLNLVTVQWVSMLFSNVSESDNKLSGNLSTHGKPLTTSRQRKEKSGICFILYGKPTLRSPFLISVSPESRHSSQAVLVHSIRDFEIEGKMLNQINDEKRRETH